jgi:signal peptidase I
MTRKCPDANSMRAMPFADTAEFAGLCAEILSRGASVRFKARGFSMKPFIMDGDLILVVPIPAAQLRRGDVVLYSGEAGALRAHRIISLTGRGDNKVFGIRGDSSAGPLEQVTSDRVLGRVILAAQRGRSHNIGRIFPRYRALLRLHGRQILHHMAPAASRNAWNALRKLKRLSQG